MSYEHLAGRIIETQRSLLGQRAVDIARSVEGLSVTDDGTVTRVTGDDREVIGSLVEEYESILGQPAASRFQSAAAEFEDEVVLPENLGGPAEPPATDGEGDAGTGSGDPVEPTEADGPTGSTEADGGTRDAVSPESGTTGGTVVEYATRSDAPLTVEIDSVADLSSVYVVAEDENGWEWRLTVEDAVLNAVTSATDLSIDAVGPLGEYVDGDLDRTGPGSDGGICFEVEGHRLTLGPDGDVHVE